jgi:hypothetical protein
VDISGDTKKTTCQCVYRAQSNFGFGRKAVDFCAEFASSCAGITEKGLELSAFAEGGARLRELLSCPSRAGRDAIRGSATIGKLEGKGGGIGDVQQKKSIV